jgi:hypothetical protein
MGSLSATALEEALLERLAELADGATASELAAALRVRPARVREALRGLIDEGALRPPERLACRGGYRILYRAGRATKAVPEAGEGAVGAPPEPPRAPVRGRARVEDAAAPEAGGEEPAGSERCDRCEKSVPDSRVIVLRPWAALARVRGWVALCHECATDVLSRAAVREAA